jgi:NAD(P)H-hydrate epimerase
MLPVVTPDEMRAIDAAAPEPVEVLIQRAGSAVARAAVRMLGGTYGRRVVVIAGTGNNGNDGRVAARLLTDRGVKVTLLNVAALPPRLPPCDLVVDAAFGTGFHGEWFAPDAVGAPVLAVDIPSGVNGATGAAGSSVLAAQRTVTFAAYKPGLLFPPGRSLAGEVEVVDIGLDTSAARVHVVEASDVADWWRPRAADAHKWNAAVYAVAGSPGMTGAAHLCVAAAMRAGAGMVHLSSPGVVTDHGVPTEVVARYLPSLGWASDVLSALPRFKSLVIGPGIGRDDRTASEARRLVLEADVPVVIDGDGLFAMSWNPEGAVSLLRRRTAPTVLTPHDGEYGLLTGGRPAPDRIAAARRLASDSGAVVLLKGQTTTVAEPGGRALLVTSGDNRLATAGTGDVLAGIIGALVARGLPAFEAAAAGAWIHGRAGQLTAPVGMVASDLVTLVPTVLAEL